MRPHSNLKIGIIGTRDIVSEEIVRNEVKNRIMSILDSEQTNNFTGYSSLAKGADSIFFEIVVDKFGQPIKAVLPFDSIEYENDFDSNEDILRYKKLIGTPGVDIITIHEKPTSKEEREDAYFSA